MIRTLEVMFVLSALVFLGGAFTFGDWNWYEVVWTWSPEDRGMLAFVVGILFMAIVIIVWASTASTAFGEDDHD